MSDQLFYIPAVIIMTTMFIISLFYVYLKDFRTRFFLLYIIFLIIYCLNLIIAVMFPGNYFSDFIFRSPYVIPILLSLVYLVWTIKVINRLRKLGNTHKNKVNSRELKTRFFVLYIIFAFIWFLTFMMPVWFPGNFISDFVFRPPYVIPILLSLVFLVWSIMGANRYRRSGKANRNKKK